MRNRNSRLPAIGRRLAAIALIVSVSAFSAVVEGQDADAGRRAARRTPVVEVFNKYNDSVVFLTGPMVKKDGPTTDEFFILPKTENVMNVGSGFVVHPAGYVVINAHATKRVIALEVVLSDGKKCAAELVGLILNQDLALVKIEPPRPLNPVKLAGSGDLMIGETVIVIGNPHRLLHSCTAGVLSAVDRSTDPSGLPGITLRDLIQTDAAINPGSSGCPWFNALGEVIGVTASRKDDADNIAFAISVATLRNYLPKMLDVERRYGLVTGLAVRTGAPCRVASVAGNSPAARAGLKPGDVLLGLDGKSIPTATDYHLALVGRQPGQTLKLRVLHDGKQADTSLTITRRAQPDGAALLKSKFGFTAVPLDKQTARETALRVHRGVIITKIDEGLYEQLKPPPRSGDILARINGFRPRDLDHVGLLLEHVRRGQTTEMVLLRLRDEVATRVDLKVVAR